MICQMTMFSHIFVVYGFALLFISLVYMGLKMIRHLNRVLITLHTEQHPKNWNEKDVKAVVKYAVQHHQRCIAFGEEINAIFNISLLLDVWTYLFGLCAVTYHMVKVRIKLN
jgi:hypothetical protein